MFERLGPYHVARLAAVGRRLGSDEVLALEVAGESREYPWDPVQAAGFARRTIITDRDYQDVPWRELRRRVVEVLEDVAPHAVAVSGWGFPEARAAVDWCRRRRVTAVLMADSQMRDARRSPLKEALKRSILRYVDAALVGGRRHTEYLKQLGFPEDRICVGYDAVDNAYFTAGAAAARADRTMLSRRLDVPERFLLASARFVAKKNLARLLQAFAMYRRQTGAHAWDLVLLGDGPERAHLEALRTKLGLLDSVRMPGFKQYDELPAYYGLAKAFILPSTTEQWGLVVNEAMAAQLPVLVSWACGSAELVADGTNGYRFDPESPADIARAIRQITDDEPRLEAMGAAAQQSVARVSPEAFADGLERAIDVGARHAASRPAPALVRPSLWV